MDSWVQLSVAVTGRYLMAASWKGLRNRAAAARQQQPFTSSRRAGRTNVEWRDADGRSLRLLDHHGLDQAAAALRSSRAGRSPAGRRRRDLEDGTQRGAAAKKQRPQHTDAADVDSNGSGPSHPDTSWPRESSVPPTADDMPAHKSHDPAADGQPTERGGGSHRSSAGWQGTLLRQFIRMGWNAATLPTRRARCTKPAGGLGSREKESGHVRQLQHLACLPSHVCRRVSTPSVVSGRHARALVPRPSTGARSHVAGPGAGVDLI